MDDSSVIIPSNSPGDSTLQWGHRARFAVPGTLANTYFSSVECGIAVSVDC